jgi:hypothetical protein
MSLGLKLGLKEDAIRGVRGASDGCRRTSTDDAPEAYND